VEQVLLGEELHSSPGSHSSFPQTAPQFLQSPGQLAQVSPAPQTPSLLQCSVHPQSTGQVRQLSSGLSQVSMVGSPVLVHFRDSHRPSALHSMACEKQHVGSLAGQLACGGQLQSSLLAASVHEV